MITDEIAGTEPDYRFTLANERTYLAWVRTSLALIASGVALMQFVPEFGIPGARHVVSIVLVTTGGLLAMAAARRRRCVDVPQPAVAGDGGALGGAAAHGLARVEPLAR
ncbi:inner membrane protein yidH [Mycobacteroides abscessus subsp. abscessus]|nr:inner membrane protein yidH [Mycobacteroides abscessus subsp. abscessus]